MAKADPVVANDLKSILDKVVGCRSDSLPTTLIRRTRRLRRDGWLAALDRAIGKSVQRKRAAAKLLAELTDLPEVAERFECWLKDDNLDWRAEVIALVGDKQLVQFAPLLNDALEGAADELCQAYAITAAERLKAEANLLALLELAGDPTYDPLFRRLLPALTAFTTLKCRPALRRFFHPANPKEVRIFAAWGLGKIGDEEAINYLVAMLDDPVVSTPTSFDPGESRRAGQALCDIFGWPCRWDGGLAARTKNRWLRSGQEQSRSTKG